LRPFDVDDFDFEDFNFAVLALEGFFRDLAFFSVLRALDFFEPFLFDVFFAAIALLLTEAEACTLFLRTRYDAGFYSRIFTMYELKTDE
jgi:hypothetical protein